MFLLRINKVLLVSIDAKYVHSNLANLYIAANYSAVPELNVMEFTIKDQHRSIVNKVVASDAGLVCFSTYIWNIELVLSLCLDLKMINPELKIVLAGPEADNNYRNILEQNDSIDYIYRGEGDLGFSDFVESLSLGKSLPSNIATRDCQAIRPYCTTELSSLRSPYNEENIDQFKNRLVYYETSRGCPFNCSYCLSSAIKGVRYFDLERIEDDFALFIRFGVGTVKIVDRTFNLPEQRSLKILEIIKRLNAKCKGNTIFHVEIVADILSEKYIEQLKSLPRDVVQLEIGIQSTNEKTLLEIGRRVDITKLRANVLSLLELNSIHVHLDLIAGLPFEGLSEFKESFNFVLNMNPHVFQLGFLKRLWGTRISEQDEHGFLFSQKPPYEIYYNRYISFEELNLLRKVEDVIDRIYNSRKFVHTWKVFGELYGGDFFAFCEEFVIYLDRNVPEESSFNPRAMYLYLYAFISDRWSEKKEYLIEVLAFDYLLVERPKYFPEWLPFSDDKKLNKSLTMKQFNEMGLCDAIENEHLFRKGSHLFYVVRMNLDVVRKGNLYELKYSNNSHKYLFYYGTDMRRLEMFNVVEVLV